MAEKKLRLDLELLLPEATDAADACVERLQDLLKGEPGISGVHVTGAPGNRAPLLCLHYDPRVWLGVSCVSTVLIERPLAVVMIGGLMTSTISTLLVLPAFYLQVQRWLGRRAING